MSTRESLSLPKHVRFQNSAPFAHQRYRLLHSQRLKSNRLRPAQGYSTASLGAIRLRLGHLEWQSPEQNSRQVPVGGDHPVDCSALGAPLQLSEGPQGAAGIQGQHQL